MPAHTQKYCYIYGISQVSPLEALGQKQTKKTEHLICAPYSFNLHSLLTHPPVPPD